MKKKIKIKCPVYVVMNDKEQFFRANGYGGGRSSWTESQETARIYSKIGPARAVVSYFSDHFPEYPQACIYQMVEGYWIKVDDLDFRNTRQQKKDRERERKEELVERIIRQNPEYIPEKVWMLKWPISKMKSELRRLLAKNIKL